MKASLNQLANVKNSYQGNYPRVLFLCSAGLLRSATAAHMFSAAPYQWNTRTAGTNAEYALNVVSEALLYWADHIICMEMEHLRNTEKLIGIELVDLYRHKISTLAIPDIYPYRHPELIALLEQPVRALNIDNAAE
jgi:predicted protein tyrosine phosphatase